jgi:ankyrin repeat protein
VFGKISLLLIIALKILTKKSITSISKSSLLIIKLKLKNSVDSFGNTALHLASIGGFGNIVKMLLNNDSDFEIENKEGWRPRELI